MFYTVRSSRLVLRPLPERAIYLLGRHERPHVRHWVAELPDCPAPLLDELVRDPDPSVRSAVARWERAPSSVLALLARDVSMPVWAAVAMRTDAPDPLLLALLCDEIETVRAYAGSE